MAVSAVAPDGCHIAMFDIATMSNGNSVQSHAALCYQERTRISQSSSVVLFHMRPPIREEEISGIEYVGAIDLTEDEQLQIRVFVDECKQERKAFHASNSFRFEDEYIVFPDATPPTSEYSMWRYSCVGFVRTCYRNAGIELIDSDSLPSKTIDQIKLLYPGISKRLDQQEWRCKVLGLCDGDSWPISLVGYLLHSLNRSESEIRQIPYCPNESDEEFSLS